jgi:predicted ATPase/class 3 adenylate cyclase/tetratricopeptide (TPR) repeat protein
VELPSGTVTFCFTDIEGSTKLFHRLGDVYVDLLEQHRVIVRAAVRAHDGVEVNSEGDGFFFAFPSAAEAVAAALDAQRGLIEHEWPEAAAIRVRMGLHTGEATPVGNDYLAFAVHEAARVAGTGHGGQVVVSQATVHVVGNGLPSGTSFMPLGDHQLKDLGAPIELYQMCHPSLPRDFPTLRSVAGRRHNLPAPVSTFIGRGAAIEAVSELVRSGARLVTLTGAGGSGKTRLALEVATEVLADWPDGVWFIDLSPVAAPGLVAAAVIQALGLTADAEADPLVQLVSHLAVRRALLIVDNCEHVVRAVAEAVSALLEHCPSLAILATSREGLSVTGESVWPVPSLSAFDAVELFVERATQAKPGFAELGDHGEAITQICERLDGIPLALELAASRVRLLTPSQIAERLHDRFRLLTGGPRTAIPRQRTLEATVDWSHELLDEDERRLFRRLSVFAGGFTLEAAEAICGDETLDLLGGLVDKSLVIATAGAKPRYRMLETIRHYSSAKVVAAAEVEAYRDRHAVFFADLVEAVAPGLRDGREVAARQGLQSEQDNVRAALEWAHGAGDAAMLRRMAGELWMFWAVAGALAEGTEWVHRAIALDGDDDPARLALVYAGAAHLRWIGQGVNELLAEEAEMVGRLMAAVPGPPRWFEAWMAAISPTTVAELAGLAPVEASEHAVELAREAGDGFVLAHALMFVASAYAVRGRTDEARVVAAEALSVAEALGARSSVSQALDPLARLAVDDGNLDEALGLAARGVAAAREGANTYFLIFALRVLADVRGYADHPDPTGPLFEALAIARDAGIEVQVANAQFDLAYYALAAGNFDEARQRLDETKAIASGLAAGRPPMFLLAAAARHAEGEVALLEGDLSGAREIFDEVLGLARGTGMRWVIGFALNSIGWWHLVAGDLAAARAAHLEAAAAVSDEDVIGWKRTTQAGSLRGLASAEIAADHFEAALRLSGAASPEPEPDRLSPRVGTILHKRALAVARGALGEDAFAAAWAEGGKLMLDQALAEAEAAWSRP